VTVAPSRVDADLASLTPEYDALEGRFAAVNQSLTQRARDLGDLPPKPEIAAALGTTRADLAAVGKALEGRNCDAAKLRMERVKKNLSYLESL
jgi:hypothetical protein